MKEVFTRKEAVPMERLLRDYVRSMGLAPKMNSACVFRAWDEVSGAERFTLKRFFRSGKLYITLSSAVIRSQLYYQKDILTEKINAKLAEDLFFDSGVAGAGFVEELILK